MTTSQRKLQGHSDKVVEYLEKAIALRQSIESGAMVELAMRGAIAMLPKTRYAVFADLLH